MVTSAEVDPSLWYIYQDKNGFLAMKEWGDIQFQALFDFH